MRNLLFLGLVGGATVLAAQQLFPARPHRIDHHDTQAYHAPDFRAAVARVDAAFRQRWEGDQLRTAAPAPDLLVARRLALGLMGTVPSLEEIRQFEHLPADQRLAWWLDHILEDRRFADYFGERFARAFVGTENGPFIFYRRRRFVSWLSDEIARNRPYDEVVRELIASEGLWTSAPATNFVSVTAQQDNRNQPDPIRLAGRSARAFLGLRLDCAQCHDHPYAQWRRSDFEALAAFFGQTRLGFTGIYTGKGEFEPLDRRTQKPHVVAPKVPFDAGDLPDAGTRRQRFAEWVTSNPYFARAAVNRVWALLTGRPLSEPVDNLEMDDLPPVLQVLADDFAANGHDLRRLIRIIAWTQAYRMDSKAVPSASEEERAAWAVFPLTRLRPEQVVGSLLQAASVRTIDRDSHIFVRLASYGQTNEFVERYGDSGEDEFSGRGGTVPQRLLLMNGRLTHEHLKENPFNAATQIGNAARDDAHAIETSYLAVLTRRPTPAEAAYFAGVLADTSRPREERMEDLHWALINATEFSWNH